MKTELEMTRDALVTRMRGIESRLARVEDNVGHYGPPDPRPIFTLRAPRVSLSSRQTTFLVYGLFFLGVGLYTLAKLRNGEDPLS